MDQLKNVLKDDVKTIKEQRQKDRKGE